MKKYIILSSMLFLAGCGTTGILSRPQVHPPLPGPVNPVDFSATWKVVTPKVAQTMLNEVQSGARPPFVLFSLTDQDYLTHLEQDIQLIAKLQEWQALACSYRKELNEPVCKRYNDPQSTNK